MEIRKVTMKWTQRNIDRINKWFKLDNNWDGTFTSSLGYGYKLSDSKKWGYIHFVFTEYKKAVR